MALHQKSGACYFVFASGMIVHNTSRITGKFCIAVFLCIFFKTFFFGK